jgi:hypothetical protein
MTSDKICGRVACWLAVAAAMSASVACADGQRDPAASQTNSAESRSIEDRTLIAVSKAIRESHLTNRPDECLAYRFDSKSLKDSYLVEVRENHQHPGCGGDPQTQPRLFTVKVDKKSHKMSTDVASPGKFHPLQN